LKNHICCCWDGKSYTRCIEKDQWVRKKFATFTAKIFNSTRHWLMKGKRRERKNSLATVKMSFRRSACRIFSEILEIFLMAETDMNLSNDFDWKNLLNFFLDVSFGRWNFIFRSMNESFRKNQKTKLKIIFIV
jgi:hypothetical protein